MRAALFSLILSFCFAPLNAENLFLKDNLQKAQAGDYVVIANEKNKTLMRVLENNKTSITIEEITLPGRMSKHIKNWAAWAESGAKGQTAWVRYKVDLHSGHTYDFTSLSEDGWRDTPQVNHLFSTLLNLPFSKVPDRHRRRIGNYRPTNNNVDSRFFWHPPLVINGQKIKGAPFEAWQARWPKDGSELSGKPLEIYLPLSSQNCPAYFPYWIEVNEGFKVRMHVSDSGISSASFASIPD